MRSRCSARRRLQRSTMPLVCGRKGRVRRWAMACRAQARSKGCAPEGLSWGLSWGLSFLSTAKRVGEFGAVVGEDAMDREREAVEKALEEGGRGFGPAIGEDFEIDKAGGAIDGAIGIAAPPVEVRQRFDDGMDDIGRGIGLGGGGRTLL